MQVFVTGSSSGIGKAMCELLLEKGIKVDGMSRNTSIQHPSYTHHFLDLAAPRAVESFRFSTQETDTLILINNAGILGNVAPFATQNISNIQQVMQINFQAPAVLTHKFLQLETTAKKIIINISSGAAKSTYDGWSMYSASKAALDAFTRVLATELQKQNQNTFVFSIAPGVIDTPMQSQIRATSQAQFSKVERFVQLKENNELSAPEHVASDLFRVIESAEKIKETVFKLSDLDSLLN